MSRVMRDGPGAKAGPFAYHYHMSAEKRHTLPMRRKSARRERMPRRCAPSMDRLGRGRMRSAEGVRNYATN